MGRPQPTKGKRESELGHGCGVGPLPTGPDPILVDHSEKVLDPSERELHPLERRPPGEVIEKIIYGGVIPPHESIGMVDRNQLGAPFSDRGLHPRGRSRGSYGDPSSGGRGHERSIITCLMRV